ncbi:MAG: hypothetical protein QOI16_391 [Pseudonocardiales bacterium]|nr:hypothetical protein [Pseudonocardiales bacterium]
MSRAFPRYRDLPIGPLGVRSAWGLWGEGESLGRAALLDDEVTRAAATLVRTGRRFPLDLPVGTIDPPLFARGAAQHTVIEPRPGRGLDDFVDNWFPQASSQWDALGHVAAHTDAFYNGATRDEVVVGHRNTIDHWARHGIVTRGVLLDVADVVTERGGPGESVPVTVEDLERARAATGLELRSGDILMVHTGFVAWHVEQPAARREAITTSETLTAVGIAQSEEMAEYLWDSGVFGVASDAPGLECWPPDRSDEAFPFGFMHRTLIGLFGMAIGELWDLRALVADCRADGVWEAMVASAPINLVGGIGSAANAVAVK